MKSANIDDVMKVHKYLELPEVKGDQYCKFYSKMGPMEHYRVKCTHRGEETSQRSCMMWAANIDFGTITSDTKQGLHAAVWAKYREGTRSNQGYQ